VSNVGKANKLRVSETVVVSSLWQCPRNAKACFVLAHGAGAGMNHAFMESVASALTARDARRRTDLPLIAGGRSFGGRMTSQAQAELPLPSVVGLAFLGFPLHPAKRPSEDRAEHLFQTRIPLLFLQGTLDELADLTLLKALVARLGKRATLKLFDDANHAFHVPARSGRTDVIIFDAMMDGLVEWIDAVITD
jgi:predicted alpha/beta-hydrolase family hydrolase